MTTRITNFNIVLEKPKPVYYAGETISGVVNLRVLESTKINVLKLIVNGESRILSDERKQARTNRPPPSRRNGPAAAPMNTGPRRVQNHLAMEAVFTKTTANNENVLTVGDHSYPFKVPLPTNLPTSFEHERARIRYSLIGNINIPWAYDINSYRAITVINNLDLNDNTALTQQSTTTRTERFGKCCPSKPVKVSMSVRRGGYVPGESIFFNIDVNNESSKDMTVLMASFIQIIRLKTNQAGEQILRYVNSLRLPTGVPKKSADTFTDLSLFVPPVSPTTIGQSELIDVSYKMEFTYWLDGVAESTSIETPIVVGTIPVNDTDAVMASHENNLFTFEPSTFGSISSPMLNNQISGRIIQSDENIYVPLYPFYRF